MSSHLPRRITRFHCILIALFFIAAPPACATRQNKGPAVKLAAKPAPGEPAEPMARFARLVGGEWQVGLASGETGRHAWHWGPGRHSMRRMTYGSDTADNPWAGEVMYWHPGRRVVCLLSMHEDIPAVGRGVAEGTIKFEGETTDSLADLYQPRGLRKLRQTQVFDGPDKYHETLLEDTGSGFGQLAAWDFFRVRERPTTRPATKTASPPKLPKHLSAFEALVGHTWEAAGKSRSGTAFRIQTTYEWVPSLEVIFARIVEPVSEGEPATLLEAYVYQHVATKALRCLGLSNRGGVYEGGVTVLDDGALQLDLKGYEGDEVIPYIVRLEVEKDGTMRNRVWAPNGTERTLLFDANHKRLEPNND